MKNSNDAPKDIIALAEKHNFSIMAWSKVDGVLRGNSQDFIGTHAEIRAYLDAWNACVETGKVERVKMSDRDWGVKYSMLSMVSNSEIPPGQMAQITARPQITFRGMRLAVTDTSAPFFGIQDIRVGHRSVFPQSGRIPAEAFACHLVGQAKLLVERIGPEPFSISIQETAVEEFGKALPFPTCLVAQEMMIYLENTSDRPRRFEGFIIGKSLE